MASTDFSLPLRITIVDPPEGVRLQMQRDRSELVPPARETKSMLRFDFEVRVIPLGGITWKQIDEARSAAVPIETTIPGTGRDGGPTCATVKQVVWRVMRSTRER